MLRRPGIGGAGNEHHVVEEEVPQGLNRGLVISGAIVVGVSCRVAGDKHRW